MTNSQIKKERLISLDGLRGFLIILMAIDHASWFISKIHPLEFWGISLPQYDSVLAFLTRFITHPCAPGFIFLMGTSMMLFAESRRRIGWSEGRITRYFVIRGFLLLVIQQFIVNPAWYLGILGANPDVLQKGIWPGGGDSVVFQFEVLFSIGTSMIICSLLLRVRKLILFIVSFGAICATQLLIPDSNNVDVLYSPLLRVLFIPGQTDVFLVEYPLLPWIGLAGLGLIFGKELLQDKERAFRGFFIIGIVLLLVFTLIRIFGGFGNFHPPIDNSWISFLNVTKYPPSLAFIFLTLGLFFLLLYLFFRFEKVLTKWGNPLVVFGQAPFFFYIIHLYIFALIGLAFPNGTNLFLMYPFWAVVLLLLFPLCRLYGSFKRGTVPNSVWRFF